MANTIKNSKNGIKNNVAQVTDDNDIVVTRGCLRDQNFVTKDYFYDFMSDFKRDLFEILETHFEILETRFDRLEKKIDENSLRLDLHISQNAKDYSGFETRLALLER